MAEVLISGTLMLTVLLVSTSRRYQAYAGLAAACLVALFITFEAPLSGMSINPARTLGSAILAGEYHAIWIYFAAPTIGMLAAAEIFCRRRRSSLLAS